MFGFRKISLFIGVQLLLLAAFTASSFAQVTTGNVRGIVKDPSGAIVEGANVTITDPLKKTTATSTTTGNGEFEFHNLLPGIYAVKVEAPNFAATTLDNVRVQLNQTTDLPIQLQIGATTATVNVSAGGTELVDTTTLNLSKQFSDRQVVELGMTGQTGTGTGTGAGVNNLSLLSANVTSNGGVGVGVGGSVGGQRPRNNNFIVDGVDNNDKAVTGPQVYVSPETVSEFSLLTNQYSAEFARSTGGQFVTVTKSGGNDFHGTGYDFFRNRKLNALDTLDKVGANVVREDNPPLGFERQRRYDYNRYGFNLSGPLYFPRFGEGGPDYYPWSGKNKLFFFVSLENLHYGFNSGASQLEAPTAFGLTQIENTPGVSPTNLGVFRQFVPVAPLANGDSFPLGTSNVELGLISVPAPFTEANRNIVVNFDFDQSSTTTHHTRFIWNRLRQTDNLATLPAFFTEQPTDDRLFSYTMNHTFSPHVTNELRLSYRRHVFKVTTPDLTFPGLDQFPNIDLDDIFGGGSIGPDPNAPQQTIENNYQVVDNVSWLRGNHSFKFGGDFRKLISPQTFVQRQRGDYEYTSVADFLFDFSPVFGERNVGANTYYGDQKLLFTYAQDDWRLRPNLTLNLGVNYVYEQMPFGARQQSLNQAASVPGLIEFNSPKSQTKNFAPRVGLAYSPNYNSGLLGKVFGSGGKSSIRAGFTMAYDVIFDNIFILSSPPQFQQTKDFNPVPAVPGFLEAGGISPAFTPVTGVDPVTLRGATSTWIPDQQLPYSLSWSLSYEREIHKDYAVEFRYLGTRGIHLLTQNQINVQPLVNDGPGGFLPTFLSAPSQSTIDALGTSLADINDRSRILPAFAAAGFTSNITAFLPNGNSTYHGGSAQLTRRLTNGLQFSAAYTYSHLIDDTTAEVFSTVLTPRRVQDFQNLRTEKADSALDRRHRFVLSGLYDLPFFRKSDNSLIRHSLGGWSMAGVLSFESGEKATVLSGIDSNLNGDRAPDRTIINPSGVTGTASTVVPLLSTCTSFDPTSGTCDQSDAQRTVAYLATNPNAQYIQAGNGALANSGRNTLQLPGINNLDISFFKNFHFTESKKIQFRADFFNVFNKAQYTPGSIDSVDPVTTTGVGSVNTINAGTLNLFNQPGQIFSSHPRVIQLALRFEF
jgi:hypothetical protein